MIWFYTKIVNNINFEKVSIKNFLSVGEEEVFLDFKNGIHLITGENKDKDSRNGVGKTSILEAIYWCLFGNTIRDLKKDNIIHNQTKSNCKVVLNLKINENLYKITRSLEPTKLFITKNDEDITLSTILKTEELIKNLLNANEEVFQNAVIMTANNTIPFMAQKKIDKRKFVEGILNLGIFGEILLKIRSEYNDLKKQNDLKVKDYSNSQKNLQIFKDQVEIFEKNKLEKIKRIENKIKDCKNILKELESEIIVENSSIKEEIKNLEIEIESLEKNIKDESSELKIKTENKNKIKFLIENYIKTKDSFIKKGNKCPSCNREYDNINHINKELEILEKNIKEEAEKYKEAKNSEKNCEDKINELEKNLNSKRKTLKDKREESIKSSVHEEKIKNTKNKINEEEKELNFAKKEVFDDKNIKKEQALLEILEKDLENIQKNLLILENCKFIVSEEGIKTFLVKKIIKLLNSQLNFYLNALDAPCKCLFDESFEETIYNSQGKECSYFNFSGGERKRIDIAILFMFQDILRLQTGISFNLSIYDELFDSALDQKGISKILEILRERSQKYKECIYVISHNKSSSLENFDEVIQLQKIDGKTSRLY